MATARRISIGLIIALFTLPIAGAVRSGGPARTAPLASPVASRPTGTPTGPAGLDLLLKNLLDGDYTAEIEAYPVLNGEEAPPSRLSLSVRHDPDLFLHARGQAATSDEGNTLAIEAAAACGRLSYTTSALGEWLAEDYKDPRQVYSLFGLIDDLGLLIEALAAGAPAQPAPDPSRRLVVLPDGHLVQRLLAAREEVIAEGSEAVYTLTEAPGGAVEVLGRLVYEVGGNRYEVNRITRIAPAKGRIS